MGIRGISESTFKTNSKVKNYIWYLNLFSSYKAIFMFPIILIKILFNSYHSTYKLLILVPFKVLSFSIYTLSPAEFSLHKAIYVTSFEISYNAVDKFVFISSIVSKQCPFSTHSGKRKNRGEPNLESRYF